MDTKDGPTECSPYNILATLYWLLRYMPVGKMIRKGSKGPKPKRGRPSTVTPAVQQKLFREIASSDDSLERICRRCGTSRNAVLRVLCVNPEFRAQYAQAKELQAEVMADRILTIADDGENDTYTDAKGRERTDRDVIERSKLRVDTRKWVMAHLLPRKYGDKLDINASVTVTPAQQRAEAWDQFAAMRAKEGEYTEAPGPQEAAKDRKPSALLPATT